MMWLVRLACPLLNPTRRIRACCKRHWIFETNPVPRKPYRRRDDQPKRKARKCASPHWIAQQVHPTFSATMQYEGNDQRCRQSVRRAREPCVVPRQHSQEQEKSRSHQRLLRSLISPILQPEREVREVDRRPNE